MPAPKLATLAPLAQRLLDAVSDLNDHASDPWSPTQVDEAEEAGLSLLEHPDAITVFIIESDGRQIHKWILAVTLCLGRFRHLAGMMDRIPAEIRKEMHDPEAHNHAPDLVTSAQWLCLSTVVPLTAEIVRALGLVPARGELTLHA